MFKWLSVIVLAVAISPVVALANIQIVYVECNPVGSDADGEYIKIKNIGSESVDLTGWKFNDGSNHIINAPPKNGGKGSLILPSGVTAVLANKADKISIDNPIILDTTMSLSNKGDTIKLLDQDKNEVASVTYTEGQVVEGGSCINSAPSSSSTGESSSSSNNTTTVREITKYRTVEIQPPQAIHIRPMPEITSLLGGTISINPEVYDATGKIVPDVSCEVTFGDGSLSKSCKAKHIYEYIGEYIVNVEASKGVLNDKTQFKVKVVEPQLSATVSEGRDYVELHNYAQKDVELNGWSLQVGYRRFNIPSGTLILANSSIKIPESVTKINLKRVGGNAELRNVFNKTVNYTQPINEPVSSLRQDSNSKPEEIVAPSITDPIEDIINMQDDTKSLTRSIIGAVIESNEAVEQRESNVAPVPIEAQAMVASANTVSESIVNIEGGDRGMTKWLLAVGALILLGLVPLFVGKEHRADTTMSEVKDDDESANFTITQVT